MSTAITMTKPEKIRICPTADNRRGWDPGKARKLDADYLKARERLRTILSGLSAIVDYYDDDGNRNWGHVGDMIHYAETLEGALGLGETMEDGSSAFHPDNLRAEPTP